MKRMRQLALLLVLALTARAVADVPNILFYGNSFTIGTGFGSTKSVNVLVRDIAVAAGNPQPYVYSGAAAGQSLGWHRNYNTSIITTALPAGQHWDFVVLQDYSTQPTHIGNLAAHRLDYVGLQQTVAAHSPNVKAVGFETWARAPGHSYYSGASPSFPGGPAQMQQELRDGYALSTADANLHGGAGSSEVAPVGSAWENAGWTNLHASDLYHANNRGTLLAAMVIYSTIYDDNVSDIGMSAIASSLGITAVDAAYLAGIADATTVPEPTTALLLAAAALTAGVRPRAGRRQAPADRPR